MRGLHVLGLVALILAAGAAQSQQRGENRTIRQHFIVTDAAGQTFEMTELVLSADERRGLVTLWQDARGQRYVFSFLENLYDKKTTGEVKNLGTGMFLRGSFFLPYNGDTPAQRRASKSQLRPDDYLVSMTVETNGHFASARTDDWVRDSTKKDREELRRRTNPALLAAFRSMTTNVLVSGSPAVRQACHLVNLVVPGNACRRDRAVKVVPVADDCEFDARFGYPCATR